MDTPTQPALTRRDLLKYALGGSAVVLLAPLAEGNASATTLDRNLRAVGQSAKGGKRGGTLKFARSIAPTTLDPANTIIAGDIYTLDKVLEPLYITNPAGQLVPWLATGYELSANHRTFTFTLRPGVKFSDGKPLVAEDVVFSINRARKNAAGPLSFLDSAITDIEPKGPAKSCSSCPSPGPRSFPTSPCSPTPSCRLTSAARPRKSSSMRPSVPARSPSRDPYARRQFADIESQPLLLAERQAVPGLRRVPIRGQRQPAGAAGPGRPGRHHRHRAPGQRLLAQAPTAALTVDLFPAWQVDLLVMNERLPQFADRHVRRAITYAINRPALVHAASFGTAKPGGSFFPPSLEYYAAGTPVLEYSLATGQSRAGAVEVPQGFFDEIAHRRGSPEMGHLRRDHQGPVAGHSGLTSTITPLDHSDFESTFQKYDYDMFIDYAINDISDPDEMASFEVDVKNGGSESYWSNYNNPDGHILVHASRSPSTTTPKGRPLRPDPGNCGRGRSVRGPRLPALYLCRVRPGPWVCRQPGRRLPPRGRLANLIGCCIMPPDGWRRRCSWSSG